MFIACSFYILHSQFYIPMHLSRLSGRKVCERVKTKGMLWKGKHMQARILFGLPRNLPENTPPSLLVGILTSVRLDKSAVKRNRMRRRCREALRIMLQSKVQTLIPNPHPQSSAQLLILPRSSSLSSPFGEILADAKLLLSFLSARG